MTKQVAEELRASIERKFEEWGRSNGLNVTPTASIGVVVAEGNVSSAELIRVLDKTQQRAKSEGKNRVVLSVIPPSADYDMVP